MAEIVMGLPSENLIALFIRFERTSKIRILSANRIIGSSCGLKNMLLYVVGASPRSEPRFVLV